MLLTYGAIRSSLIEGGKRQLATSTTALMKQLDVLGERVGDDVEVLSLDYALRKAVAEHDPGTALSALRNHGNRIGAARMLLVGLDGKISADTGGRLRTGTRFPFPELIRRACREANSDCTRGAGRWPVLDRCRACESSRADRVYCRLRTRG